MCRDIGLWDKVGYVATSENRDHPVAPKSVLKVFTDDALTIYFKMEQHEFLKRSCGRFAD